MPQPNTKTLSITADAAVFDMTVEALCFYGKWAQSGDKFVFAKNVLLDFLGKCLTDLSAENERIELEQQQKAAQERLIAASKRNAAVRESISITVS